MLPVCQAHPGINYEEEENKEAADDYEDDEDDEWKDVNEDQATPSSANVVFYVVSYAGYLC